MPKVKLGEVATEYKSTIKNNDGYPVVGLEHFTPGDISLTAWDEGVETTFTKGFKKGQMLFGRRRAYLKKAAVAPFDGVCSGDIIVIEPIEDKILPELLPFIIQNDLLFDYAMSKSAGGMSPRVKWKDLKEYEFDLPEIQEQNRILEALQSAYQLKKSYSDLITATDELVKSQFIEMSHKWKETVEYEPLTNFINNITYGFTNPMPDTEEGPWKITAKDVVDGRINYETARKTSKDAYYALTEKSRPKKGDVLLTKDGTLGRTALVEDEGICINQSVASIRCNDRILPEFLVSILQMPEYQEKMLEDAGGVTVKHLYITRVDKMPILVPDVNAQRAWIKLIHQSDKSKFELNQAILSVDAFIKSVVQQGLEQEQ